MFIFQLMGGLGNQMFQYAAARSLSLNRKINFKVNFDDPYTFIKRRYSLDVFNLRVEHATKQELALCTPKRRIIRRLWMVLGRNPDNKLFREREDFCFDSEFFNCPDGSYVSGFWQSEKYLKPIESTIRSEFEIRLPPSKENAVWLGKIRSSNSVSVHVRRGDYVHVQKTHDFHGVCNLDFYQKAIQLMRSLLQEPAFYFFSDDIQWVKQNIRPSSACYYIDVNNELTAYEDLRLMSACHHNIIANSSFSWWGAWLNSNPHKIVVAPRQWINNPSIKAKDLIPETWVRL